MSQWRDPPRWLESDELDGELQAQLRSYAAEGPEAARRARMLSRMEHELGFTDAASATEGGAELALGGGAKPAAVGTLGAGASAGAVMFKFKLMLGTVAILAGSLGLLAVWRSVSDAARGPQLAGFLGVPAAGGSSFRAVRPALAAELAPAAPAIFGSHARGNTSTSAAPSLGLAPSLAAVAARPEQRARPAARHLRQRMKREPSPAAQASDPVLDLERELESSTRANDKVGGALGELTLLSRARRALLAQPERSLELAEQHAREYPNGTLGEEREVLAIESLLKLRRVAAAKERVRAFERLFPHSAHRAHLARMISAPTD